MTKKHSTMLGLAIGDALGQPFEFSSAHQIIQSGWDGGMTYGDVWKLDPGKWTDDTKMALCIAESLLEKKGFDINDVAQKYIEWVETGDLRGIGMTCEASINRMKAGIPPLECGKKPETHDPIFKRTAIPFMRSAIQEKMMENLHDGDSDLYGLGDFCGNGTLMRCAPIGLFYRKDSGQRDKAATEDATMTHNHPDARDASKFLCSVVADLANDWELRPAIDNAMLKSYEYDHVPRLVKKAIDLADSNESTFANAIELGNTGTAHGTLATSVFSCLKYNSFKEAVTAAVLIGGDTDTRGAVTGAIAGTAYGLSGIPAEWVEVLEDSDRLQDIDTRLKDGS
ncbi:MAG: ADP-ribosylglycohydrolase family protein [Candidatus Hermodarchaeia archaeon]